MKQEQAREYIKPQVESYDSKEVVESLGSAAGGLVSGGAADGTPDNTVDDV